MGLNIAHCVSQRNENLSYHGMAPHCVARNIAFMATNNLKAMRRRAGLKQPAIAEAMGVSVPQVSRWETGADNIPSNRFDALAAAYQATISELFEAELPFLPIGPRLFVKGTVQAGNWVDAYEWPEDDWKTFYGRPDITVPIESRFGLRVVGNSMSAIYPHGSIVECVKLLHGAELSSGKRVVVVRQRDDMELEATVKEYVVDENGVEWLWPRSLHPEFQTPWRVDEPEPGIVSVEVVAVVVAATRYE
jgi:transcriptional regulator with XRE-family HTH domain